jgi:hypothetical protein
VLSLVEVCVALKGLHATTAARVVPAGDSSVGCCHSFWNQPAPVDDPCGVGRRVDRTRAMPWAILSSAFYGHPSAEMQVIGYHRHRMAITTDRLSGCVPIFDAAGRRCGTFSGRRAIESG